MKGCEGLRLVTGALRRGVYTWRFMGTYSPDCQSTCNLLGGVGGGSEVQLGLHAPRNLQVETTGYHRHVRYVVLTLLLTFNYT